MRNSQSKNPNTVIKKSDKVNCVLIVEKTDYLDKVEKLLVYVNLKRVI